MSHPNQLKLVRLRVLISLNWHLRYDWETRDAIRAVIKQIRQLEGR